LLVVLGLAVILSLGTLVVVALFNNGIRDRHLVLSNAIIVTTAFCLGGVWGSPKRLSAGFIFAAPIALLVTISWAHPNYIRLLEYRQIRDIGQPYPQMSEWTGGAPDSDRWILACQAAVLANEPM